MSKPTIFVQIASYRDLECQWTVKDLFKKAEFPERVFVGICWQYKHEEDKACFQIDSPNPRNTATIMFSAERSRGVCWARHQAQTLYDNEDYVLMIDSHMRFVKNWDTVLIKELEKCSSSKALLSSYPADYTPPDNLAKNPKPSFMHAQPFDVDNNLRFRGEILNKSPEKPLHGAFLAAGFIFTRGLFIKEIPYDPYIYFSNEEATLAVRAYTHGWNIYSPTKAFLYHYYLSNDDAKGKKFFHWTDDEKWVKFAMISKARNDYLLCGQEHGDKNSLIDIEKYALGTVRTLAEYEAFSGINFKQNHASKKALNAGFISNLLRYDPVGIDKMVFQQETKKKNKKKNESHFNNQISENEVWKYWKKIGGYSDDNFTSGVKELLPINMNWHLTKLSSSDLNRLYIISSEDWSNLSLDSFSVKTVAENINKKFQDEDSLRLQADIQAKVQYLKQGGSLDSILMLVAESENADKLTLIKGNKRAVSFLLNNQLEGLNVYIGVSPEIKQYYWARKTYR